MGMHQVSRGRSTKGTIRCLRQPLYDILITSCVSRRENKLAIFIEIYLRFFWAEKNLMGGYTRRESDWLKGRERLR